MTFRDVYENILIELNKVQAPSLLLNDFIYLFNKGVQKYYNERYNLFESKQQLTDDLRVLTKTVKLTPTIPASSQNYFGIRWLINLPTDYVHILNCICEFSGPKSKKNCGGDTIAFQQGANKLNTNEWSHVINNYYLRPSVKNPYYYIINLDEPADLDQFSQIDPTLSSDKITDESKKNLANNNEDVRYGNSVFPTMEIKCGDDQNYSLVAVYVDYLRAPKYYSMDESQLDSVDDTTQIVEFPDYVIYEIIDRIVRLIMENAKDQRIQTHPAINQSII